MMKAFSLFVRHLEGCLALGATLALPTAVRGGCGCGTDCSCGEACSCGRWVDPPPQDPNANTVRKNQRDLTVDERTAFVAAVKQLKETFHPGATISIYDEYVHHHMMAMETLDIHVQTAFFPWHRYLVRAFELELQAIDPTVTIPYWDFTVDNQPDSSIWASDFMGGNGDPDDGDAVTDGPFQRGQWQLLFGGPDLRRQFGLFSSHLPTPDDVLTSFLIEKYDSASWDTGSDVTRSYRNYMAGWNHPTGEPEMHNRVHNWIGGSMVQMASPNDPVFWLLHANLDRLWAEWESIHGEDYPEEGPPPGNRLHDKMLPFGITPADVLDHHGLGYFYDTETRPVASFPARGSR
jgi:tyrosinase